MTPPPNKKVKDPQASAAASAKAPGEYNPCIFSISSNVEWIISQLFVISWSAKPDTSFSKRFSCEVFTLVFVRHSDWLKLCSPSKQV